MYKIMDESILFFSRELSQNYLWKLSTFRGYIKVFIVRYEKECEKSLFSKTGCTSESLAIGMSREFQSPNNKMARLYLFSYSDLAVLALQLLACSTRVPHSDESLLVS